MRGRVAESTYVFFISWADFCHLPGIHAPERRNGVQSCSKHIYVLYFLGRLLPFDRHQCPLSRVTRGRVAASTYVFFISWADFCTVFRTFMNIIAKQVLFMFFVFFHIDISLLVFQTRPCGIQYNKQGQGPVAYCTTNKALWHTVQQTMPCGIQYNKCRSCFNFLAENLYNVHIYILCLFLFFSVVCDFWLSETPGNVIFSILNAQRF